MRQIGIFSFWDHFWGIASSPSPEGNTAGLVVSPLVEKLHSLMLQDMGTLLDPSGLSPFSWLLQSSFPFVPLRVPEYFAI